MALAKIGNTKMGLPNGPEGQREILILTTTRSTMDLSMV